MSDGYLIAYLKSCIEELPLRQRTAKDTSERWFRVERVTSSLVDEAVHCTCVRVSDVAEVGDVRYVNDAKGFDFLNREL